MTTKNKKLIINIKTKKILSNKAQKIKDKTLKKARHFLRQKMINKKNFFF